jgi:Family of unknown function (DUF6252)
VFIYQKTYFFKNQIKTMKRRWKSWLWAIALLFIANSCQKDPLPKPTQKGLNTFGCKINGEVWIPDGKKGAIPALKPIAGGFSKSGNNTFSIYLHTIKSNDQSLLLSLPNAVVGDNFFSQTLPGRINYAEFSDGNFVPFQTSSVNTGKVTITRADTVSKILSGTFEFVGGRGNEKVVVTEGRFDIKNP